MVSVITTAGSAVAWHELVPSVTRRISPGDAAARYRRLDRAGHRRDLLMDTRECLERKRREQSAAEVGRDMNGETFLPWCLAQCAETAAALGMDTVLVKCDAATWQMLSPSLSLVRSLSGIRPQRAGGFRIGSPGRSAHAVRRAG